MVILITGAGGQLGQALKSVEKDYANTDFKFCTSAEVDISDIDSLNRAFELYKPDYCINTAAYTAVDKAESEPEKAYLINVTGVKNVAETCKRYGAVLLHISTDFVFDGSKGSPYTEEDIPNPAGVYGQTKLEGEYAVQQVSQEFYIIRTSWVYSQFGHNFMKTMLRLASEHDSISVVNDQIGSPTHAADLSRALMQMIQTDAKSQGSDSYGIYNYSNEGQCSWFEFAKKIFEINKIEIDLQPIKTIDFPTAAKRPAYSVLDKSKISKQFDLPVQDWKQILTKNEG